MGIIANFPYESTPFTRINSDDDIKNSIAGDGSYLVFIQKGKPVSTKGFIIQTNESQGKKFEILQLESSTSTVPEKYALLHGDTPGVINEIYCEFLSDTLIRTFVVESEHINNNLSIKVSRGYINHIDDYIYNPYYETLNIIEPLTLAYI
ncbi:uncharacterized protein EV154DRAFT_214140 [Mucor mucedo]|uniref:uncharacterized protein n=1 Tax=Mucor mucedo TaxID=29922 RepID=UPI00221F328D|nr:uncharacterized protein EV154DRAFT_214140 [Mucor mucedo]KAI7896708.1 hypothetical protein EV154DRAFT_214140 [Mucor mucedo]